MKHNAVILDPETNLLGVIVAPEKPAYSENLMIKKKREKQYQESLTTAIKETFVALQDQELELYAGSLRHKSGVWSTRGKSLEAGNPYPIPNGYQVGFEHSDTILYNVVAILTPIKEEGLTKSQSDFIDKSLEELDKEETQEDLWEELFEMINRNDNEFTFKKTFTLTRKQ